MFDNLKNFYLSRAMPGWSEIIVHPDQLAVVFFYRYEFWPDGSEKAPGQKWYSAVGYVPNQEHSVFLHTSCNEKRLRGLVNRWFREKSNPPKTITMA